MRRKYDLRNKRNFVIILILSIIIICIFSLFIYKYNKSSKIYYTIDIGSVIQDVNKNYISIDKDATLKVRWNDSYYLIYQDKKINLGKKVIVYNTITGSMKLYGKFYEIKEDGKVVLNKDETVLSNTTDTKFYKLDDREYLLVDRKIVSDDRSIDTNDYMLVELDKMGNAKLSNYKLNLKTISSTILVTSKYSFDISNEILKYKDLNVNLKKIIGSTNQYVSEKEEINIKPDNENGGQGGNQGGTNGTNNGNGTGNIATGTGNQENVINNEDQGEQTDIGEIKDKTKMTSIVRVLEGLTQIDVDYVVYDPYNEYKSIYAEVVKPGNIEVIYLSKNDTHIVFNNLLADTEYKINFIYTTQNSESGEIITNKFDEMTLRTRKPNYSISVYKISSVNKTLTYKVSLQEGYIINKVNVNLSFDYKVYNTDTGEYSLHKASIDSSALVSGNEKSVMGTIDVSQYNIDYDTLLKLTINSVEGQNGIININSSSSFRFGR